MIEPGLTGGRINGMGVYTEALLRHLPLAGVSVTAFSYPPLRGHAELTVGQRMPQSFERAALTDLLTPRVNRVHMPADLFHVTDYRVVRMDCPLVVTLHDTLPITHPQWSNPRGRRRARWIRMAAARKADHVIAVSHSAVPELVECFGIDERVISVVPSGVDIDWLEPVDGARMAATLKRLHLAPGYFLFAGPLQPRRNVGRLLEAYLTLPADVRKAHQLVLVGAAGWRCDDVLRQIEAALQNGAKVVCLNDLTDAQTLRHVYAGAGVFVFPSLYESFGTPVVQAFASGVPVVTSNTGSLPELSQGAAVEVDPTSSDEIGAAMLDLLRDALLRKRCIAAGRRRAAQLTWQATALRTAAVYRAVLS